MSMPPDAVAQALAAAEELRKRALRGAQDSPSRSTCLEFVPLYLPLYMFSQELSSKISQRKRGKEAVEPASAAGRVKHEAQTPKGAKPGCKIEQSSPPEPEQPGLCPASGKAAEQEEPGTPNAKRGRSNVRTPDNRPRSNAGSNRKSTVKRRRMRGKTPSSASKDRAGVQGQPAAAANDPGQSSSTPEAEKQSQIENPEATPGQPKPKPKDDAKAHP